MSEYYEQPLPIRTYDIDFAGIVSNIVFIRWLEDLRLGLLDQAYPLIRALAEDIAPILLSTRINYRRPVTIADPLVGRMRVAGLTRVRWRLAAEFIGQRRGACRGRAGGSVHAAVDPSADRDTRADPPLASRMIRTHRRWRWPSPKPRRRPPAARCRSAPCWSMREGRVLAAAGNRVEAEQ